MRKTKANLTRTRSSEQLCNVLRRFAPRVAEIAWTGRPKSVEYARGGRDLASGVTMALNITVPGRWRNSDHDLECPQKPRLARITNFFSH